MPDFAHFALFLGAAIVLLLVPGPAVLYITARSIDQGRLAGIVSVLGIAVGTLVHIMAAAIGVSAILVRSALAFEVLRYAGAAYLIYLGVTKLRMARSAGVIATAPRESLRQIFRKGITVNVLNPKTALFFFAFLPQFVNPARSASSQIAILGLIFLVIAVLTDSLYAMAAASAADWLRRRIAIARRAEYAAGAVYIALGAVTALTGHRARS
ncbi:MAG TPA: LysE family translocator [Thermoanaerobaculia bacterium]|nr:LysE family translocator [Thermoanaerobaculia bacterium]